MLLNAPAGDFGVFLAFEVVAGFFWSFEWPNAVATIQDITEPEVRSTAHSIIGVAETIGSALAPLVVGMLAVSSTLKDALQTITLTAWSIGLIFLGIVLVVIPKDVQRLRGIMQQRVEGA